MGDSDVDRSPENYRQIFENLCPHYILFGATYEDFWYGDPFKLKALREAYRLKVDERNRDLWLQGLYNYNAFATVLSNAFSKKGTKPSTYLDKPIDLFEPSEEVKQERLAAEQQKAAEGFEAMAKAYKRRKQKCQ